MASRQSNAQGLRRNTGTFIIDSTGVRYSNGTEQSGSQSDDRYGRSSRVNTLSDDDNPVLTAVNHTTAPTAYQAPRESRAQQSQDRPQARSRSGRLPVDDRQVSSDQNLMANTSYQRWQAESWSQSRREQTIPPRASPDQMPQMPQPLEESCSAEAEGTSWDSRFDFDGIKLLRRGHTHIGDRIAPGDYGNYRGPGPSSRFRIRNMTVDQDPGGSLHIGNQFGGGDFNRNIIADEMLPRSNTLPTEVTEQRLTTRSAPSFRDRFP